MIAAGSGRQRFEGRLLVEEARDAACFGVDDNAQVRVLQRGSAHLEIGRKSACAGNYAQDFIAHGRQIADSDEKMEGVRLRVG